MGTLLCNTPTRTSPTTQLQYKAMYVVSTRPAVKPTEGTSPISQAATADTLTPRMLPSYMRLAPTFILPLFISLFTTMPQSQLGQALSDLTPVTVSVTLGHGVVSLSFRNCWPAGFTPAEQCLLGRHVLFCSCALSFGFHIVILTASSAEGQGRVI